jgi:hypothetical protein
MPKAAEEVAAAAPGAHKPLATLNVGAALTYPAGGERKWPLSGESEHRLARFSSSLSGL